MNIELADKINAIFYFLSVFAIWLNIYRTKKDNDLKGVSLLAILFYIVWGVWSSYFFMKLGTSCSMVINILVTVSNVCWALLAIRLKFKNKNHS